MKISDIWKKRLMELKLATCLIKYKPHKIRYLIPTNNQIKNLWSYRAIDFVEIKSMLNLKNCF